MISLTPFLVLSAPLTVFDNSCIFAIDIPYNIDAKSLQQAQTGLNFLLCKQKADF